MSDETAHVSISKIVSLEEADSFITGWKQMVGLVLDEMRKALPYADTLRLTLTCERRLDDSLDC